MSPKNNQRTSQKKTFPLGLLFMAITATFAVWVYFSEYKGAEDREKAKQESTALFSFSNVDVKNITVRSNALPETVMAKEAVWRVLKPYDDVADAMAIDGFLSTLSGEKIQDTVVEGDAINWATYGLDRPSAEIFLVAQKDGTEIKKSVQIGSVPAFDGSVYARIDNASKVVTLSSTVQAALQKDPREFRDKRFFTAKDFPQWSFVDIKSRGHADVRLAFKGDQWTADGAKWPLDQSAVTAYIGSVTGMRGNDVWAENKKDSSVLKTRKLLEPGLRVFLTASAPKDKPADPSTRMEVVAASLAKEESVAAGYGSERPVVFSVTRDQIQNLTKSIDDFRDLKFPLQFKIAEARRIVMERPANALPLPALLKTDAGWGLDPQDTRWSGRSVKKDAVDQLLSGLLALKAKRVLPLGTAMPKKSDKGAVRFSVFGESKANEAMVDLVFVSDGDAVRFSSSIVPGRVFEIEKTAYEGLLFDVLTPPADRPVEGKKP